MTNYKKGDVVLVSFTYELNPPVQERRRPAVVISIDDLAEEILVAPLTTNLPTADNDSQITLIKESEDGRSAGLRQDSVIDCTVAAAIKRALVVNKIGQVSSEIMARIDEAMGRAGGDNT